MADAVAPAMTPERAMAFVDHDGASMRTGRRATGLVRDRRGQVALEYLVLVGTMAIVLIPAFVAAGRAIVTSFEKTRTAIAHPVP